MNCKKIQELLKTDYLDGELKENLYQEVEKHLKDCPVCQKLKEELLRGKELFRNFKYKEVPINIWDSIYEKITEESYINTNLWLGFIKQKRLALVTLTIVFFILGSFIFKNILEEKAKQSFFKDYFLNEEEYFYNLGTNLEEYFI